MLGAKELPAAMRAVDLSCANAKVSKLMQHMRPRATRATSAQPTQKVAKGHVSC